MAKESDIMTEEKPLIPRKVGEILADARKKKKKEIEKIAAKLNIRTTYLRALEESDYKAFPGQVYALGFLKNYSDCLGLNTVELTEMYRGETSFIKPATVSMPIPERHSFLPAIKYLFWAAILVAIVLGVGYLAILPERAKKQELFTQLIEVPPTDKIIIAEEIATLEGAPVEEVIAVVTEPAPIDSRIKIVATSEVWIEIQDEDMILVSKVLKPGDEYMVPANSENMRLKTGNAGGMDVYVDGQKIKSLGAKGAVVSRVSLNPDTLKNR